MGGLLRRYVSAATLPTPISNGEETPEDSLSPDSEVPHRAESRSNTGADD
jgi:hypothetical protein